MRKRELKKIFHDKTLFLAIGSVLLLLLLTMTVVLSKQQQRVKQFATTVSSAPQRPPLESGCIYQDTYTVCPLQGNPGKCVFSPSSPYTGTPYTGPCPTGTAPSQQPISSVPTQTPPPGCHYEWKVGCSQPYKGNCNAIVYTLVCPTGGGGSGSGGSGNISPSEPVPSFFCIGTGQNCEAPTPTPGTLMCGNVICKPGQHCGVTTCPPQPPQPPFYACDPIYTCIDGVSPTPSFPV
jgi:hypothetical protein